MSMWGLDVEGVQRLASQMNAQAEQIDTIMHTLTSSLQGTQWLGPDHDHFVGEWNGTYVPQLTTVANGLRDAATKANFNATQQQQASTGN